MPTKDALNYVDLFAGCGGLSLGLERAGWQLELAVEKSEMAAETFSHNLVSRIEESSADWRRDYTSQDVETQASQKLVVKPVESVLTSPDIMNRLFNSDLDLVAGGPPCQGFSMAGRRKQDDSRNNLAWDFLDFVRLTLPKFVVIENVLGMNNRFKNSQEVSVFEQLSIALSEINGVTASNQKVSGYTVQKIQANALHYGAAQSRPRLLLVACRNDIASSVGVSSTLGIWKSSFIDSLDAVPDLAPLPIARNPGMTVQDALSDQGIGKRSAYLEDLQAESNWPFLQNRIPGCNHKPRQHGLRSTTKFKLMHLLEVEGLPRILIKEPQSASQEVQRTLAINQLMEALPERLPSKYGLGSISKMELIQLLDSHVTRKHSQRVVALNKPAPTVVTAADDYIHPKEPRVFTVRELARFQGFPDFFEFRGKETTGGLKRRFEVPQYSQVGNAVSPFLAHAIGKKLRQIIEKSASN